MRFGVVGCGTVAQIMHIPYLSELPEADLHAVVDRAENRVQELAQRYGVPHAYTDHESLLDEQSDSLDAVVVLTPSHAHANVVVDTLDANLHTLVEKPIAASPVDADRMVKAAAESGATAMVAYMKRYDPAFEQAKDALTRLRAVDLVTAYDVDPDHERIISEVYDLVEGDMSPDKIEASAAQRRADIEQTIGTTNDVLVDAYDFQVEHVCHDLNILRGLFGDVNRIEHVDIFADGRYATANLVYENEIRCVLETGDSERKWFEESVQVDGPDGSVHLEFSNPFIKNTPTELQIRTGTEELSDTTVIPSYAEPFKRELQHFINQADRGAEVRTPFVEARADLELIVDLFETYLETSNRFD